MGSRVGLGHQAVLLSALWVSWIRELVQPRRARHHLVKVELLRDVHALPVPRDLVRGTKGMRPIVVDLRYLLRDLILKA
jgi:hypothetical protein